MTPGAFHSSGRRLLRVDRALAVERVAERVDDAAEQRLADRDGRDLAGAAHRVALLDLVPLAEQRDADVVLLEVEREADDAVVELEHLERDAVLEPVDARDAVAELEHGADLGEVRVDVELLDPLAQDRGDLFRTQLHSALAPCGCEFLTESVEAAAHARVEAHRAGLEDDAADQVGVDAAGRLHLAPGLLLDVGDDPLELGVGELVRGRELDVEHVLLGGDERLELRGDLADLPRAALLDERARTKFRTSSSAPPSICVEHVALHPRLGLGVRRAAAASSGTSSIAAARSVELGPDDVEPALVLRGLEERAGVDALRSGYERLASSCEKSISASASSIRRCWSASVSVLRVIFSAASTDSRPTSSRISSSDLHLRLLDLPLGLLEAALAVLLGLLAHPLVLRVGDPPRLGEDLLGVRCAPGRSAPCAPRAGCAPRRGRGRPPRPTARIRSRRSSISFWIGPNA